MLPKPRSQYQYFMSPHFFSFIKVYLGEINIIIIIIIIYQNTSKWTVSLNVFVPVKFFLSSVCPKIFLPITVAYGWKILILLLMISILNLDKCLFYTNFLLKSASSVHWDLYEKILKTVKTRSHQFPVIIKKQSHLFFVLQKLTVKINDTFIEMLYIFSKYIRLTKHVKN